MNPGHPPATHTIQQQGSDMIADLIVSTSSCLPGELNADALFSFVVTFVRLTAAVGACGGGSIHPSEGGGAPPAPPQRRPAPIGASIISGSVKLEGTPPEARVIRMTSDPLCMPEGPTVSEVVLVGPGNGLQNVFVYVKDGLGDRTFTAPTTPVVLDQRGCKYMPHVFGAQVGQPVKILNSDATLHNVHAVPKENTEFNFGQPLKGMEATQTFTKSEIMVPFRCDVHGWMAAYGGIVPHPFFAVTKNDGTFRDQGAAGGDLHHRNLARALRSADADGDGGWNRRGQGGLQPTRPLRGRDSGFGVRGCGIRGSGFGIQGFVRLSYTRALGPAF